MLTLNVYVISRKYITLLSKWLRQIAKCLNWGHHVVSTSVDAPQKSQNVHKERYTWAYSWTWRHNAALLQTVGSALPQALWHR